MGVVRREGDWRLEKLEEGHYEITFRNSTQKTVLTPDHDPGPFGMGQMGLLYVVEVDSYSEVVGLFEELAHGPAPFGMESSDISLDISPSGSSGLPRSSSSPTTSDEDDLELTPGLLALALIIIGGLLASTQWPAYGTDMFQIAVFFVLTGVAILGWAGLLFKREGWGAAADFLFQTEQTGGHTSSGTSVEKTPPTPQKLKEEILFDRADHHCEWCGDRFDRLQVHHIEPRSEGGPNTERNLIALCPNCHDKADHGGISMTQLRGKIRRILAKGG